jgi:hypothetical protein
LPIAGIVGKAERLVVEHLDEPLRAAAVLDVGRALGRDRGEERGIELGDEGGKLAGHVVGKAGGDALVVAVRRGALGLRAPRGRGEDDIAVGAHGRIRISGLPTWARVCR